MKIVIDTNVFISGIFFGGVPFDVLNTVTSKKNEAYITPEIWDEYEDVIKRIAAKYPSHMKQELVDSLFKLFKIIIPSSSISLCRDPDDDKFITCAIDAKCEYIVSGDDDLLSMKSIDNITICTPAEFISSINGSTNLLDMKN